ncbi:peptidase M24, structural domain-containing protein [Corynascus novoguineensis]|uniref:Xaa-Pro aminopeptidase n=1 Tax=Corynascus novoguineensis TaxID=1126955 RepID=A0AAN7HJA4_9PEZI|nr:peptidase M24, structural domain-containing protein [Corynascus novoguineensis]
MAAESREDTYDLVEIEEFDALNQLDKAWLEADLGKFPAKTHARKVAKELGAKHGIIYIPGEEEKFYENSDMGPRFRQRRHFYYIAGADFPGCAVTYDIACDYLVLWIPRVEPRKVLWFGRTPTIEQCKAASHVDDVRYIDGLEQSLCRVIHPGCTIYALHPSLVPKIGHAKVTVVIDTTQLQPAIDEARVVKTDYEIALIRRANAVSSGAHKAVLTGLKSCTTERDIEAIFTAYCIAHGAPTQAYPVIAASGANASTLHYADNNQPLANRQLLVLDAGAEWRCYASDITRTLPIPRPLSTGTSTGARTGFPSREATAIYALVERMQEECIARARPGRPFLALHVHACAVAARGLLDLGILKVGGGGEAGGDVKEILRRGTVAAFFPHGLGHHVGLEVHDVAGRDKRLLGAVTTAVAAEGRGCGSGSGSIMNMMMTKRHLVTPQMVAWMREEALSGFRGAAERGQKLREGMVVTIEPGIYFCREYIEGYFLNDPIHSRYINKEELNKYWDVGGVRIEDDILITKDGYENLTRAPKGNDMWDVINGASLE